MDASVLMTPDRWEATKRYVEDLCGDPDDQLRTLRARAAEAGLPSIAISPDVGRILALLVATTAARTAVELGTLGGYSALFIAKALKPDGRLVTVERDEKAADFAEREFEWAGLKDRIQVLRSPALEALPEIRASIGEGAVDFAFVDADKLEYPAYWALLRPLIAVGGYFVADNVLGTNAWWIDHEDRESRIAVDRLSRTVMADEAFEAVVLTQREGLLVARRKA